MKTYLVTGGAGFIGSHIVAALVEKKSFEDSEIRVLDDFSTGFEQNISPYLAANEIQLFDGSILDANVCERATAGVDVVFHEAALASVPLSLKEPCRVHEVCATGTLQLLDAARRSGVRRVVYAASSSAYGETETSTKSESELPQPISPYGASKLAGEYYMRVFASSFDIETVCLRYFNVFGPRQDPLSPYSAVIPLFIRTMLSGQSPVIFGDGTQSRDFTHVSNIVGANLLASEAPREKVSGRVFNVASGVSSTLLALVEALNNILGTQIAPIHEAPRPGDILHSAADISAARDALGYTPKTTFVEGLRDTVRYYRNTL
ncbi:MAG: NAD-dependent epimerase/dehydratase family protein [Planctomycetia bacterium]|nr:NAD-dependent epimerase/dehydratase family protein [Planctomycetia bacterium]